MLPISAPEGFLCGIVEGFYGRPWQHATRLLYAEFLAASGLNTCLYCPKNDPWLRRRWPEHWPEAQWRELRALSAAYASAGIAWGVGLSPFELYRNYGAVQRRQLREKIGRLSELDAPLLAVLFDDMPGSLDVLAERQAEIVEDIAHWLPDTRLLVCPTYYSFDPALEQHFGEMPRDYWSTLGRALPAAADVFWTGNAVCSSSICEADIRAITVELGRAVVLWDNYPVNDGATRSNFLYTSPLSGRSTALRPLLRGHLCNPMNQAMLSLPALAGLVKLYREEPLHDETLASLLGVEFWDLLQRDRTRFECEGLTKIGQPERRVLAGEYASLSGPGAQEVAAWLRGEYAFDPACLTG